MQDFSLYAAFGKFMGQQVPPNGDLYKELKETAADLGLSTRFMLASQRVDVPGSTEERLNIVIDDQFKYISEITLG